MLALKPLALSFSVLARNDTNQPRSDPRRRRGTGGPRYGFGLRSPVVTFRHDAPACDIEDWQELDRLIGEISNEQFEWPKFDRRRFGSQASMRILLATSAIQNAAGLPVFEPGCICRSGLDRRVQAVVPVAEGRERIALRALRWSTRLIGQYIEFVAGGHTDWRHTANMRHELVRDFQRTAPAGQNTIHFLRAAHQRRIPYSIVYESCYRYGQGSGQQWLESTFTPNTSTLGVRLARNKQRCNRVLRASGLPVPDNVVANSEVDAHRAAQRMGYPVVVKPIDLDGGVGVGAGLETEEELSAAWQEARKHSENILVEKHAAGRDYRLTVFRGRLLWAIYREPGGVHGDGVSTIGQLLERLNSSPDRGDDKRSPLKRIAFDTEARLMLSRMGLDLDSVVEIGRFVPLRKASNTSRGGMPLAVNERVHPDNAELAVRAADAIRLDLAGIDLLIPDIGVSWRESSAAICEVNAQPQMGTTSQTHLFGVILDELFTNGNGACVPVYLILDRSRELTAGAALETELSRRGYRVGFVHRRGARISGIAVSKPGRPCALACQLITDRGIDALVVSIENPEDADNGLPGPEIAGLAVYDDNHDSRPRGLDRLLEMTIPMQPHRRVIVSENAAASLAESVRRFGGEPIHVGNNPNEVVTALLTDSPADYQSQPAGAVDSSGAA
ncbi:MAG: cyanophycin synthetase [Proteobacteria bacterium]|nr:MAG: cyanophycin synthetase [Pseudomonadota bacterium]